MNTEPELDESRRETVWMYCLTCDHKLRFRMLKASIARRYKRWMVWCPVCERDTLHEEQAAVEAAARRTTT